MTEFRNACLSGNISVMIELIDKGVVDLDLGLYGASRGGHLDVVKYIIEKGAVDLNDGLSGACRGGHLDVVKYIIEKGAVDLNDGLSGACRGGHLDLVNYLIQAGANDINRGLYSACQGENLPIVIKLIQAGAYIYSTCSPNPYINLLIINKHKLGGNEDELLALGIPPTIIEYSPAYILFNNQRKQECISAISKYLIYDIGKIVADYVYY